MRTGLRTFAAPSQISSSAYLSSVAELLAWFF